MTAVKLNTLGSPATNGTSGSVLFIDSGGNLAQDNPHFTFDPATNYLSVGTTGDTGIYYLNGLRSIYQIVNVAGNNWFEDNAGNLTATGSGNLATGDGCMVNLSTGVGNMGFGSIDPSGAGSGACMASLSTGSHNMAIGGGAMSSVTSGSFNTAVGTISLKRAGSDSYNVALGFSALESLGVGGGGGNDKNIGIGTQTLQVMSTGVGCVGVGNQCGSNITSSGGGDVFVGGGVAFNMLTSGGNNTMVGPASGFFISGGVGNTILGRWLGPSATVNNVLGIAVDDNVLVVDYSYIASSTFSFQHTTTAAGLHVYNTLDSVNTPTNWERAVFDWRITSNILTIGTQAGGTGTTRNLKFIIGGTNKLDYGVTTSGTWVAAADIVTTGDLYTTDAAFFIRTKATLTSGAGTGTGVTFTNAPGSSLTTGNPTKWIAIDDNGTTRYIPAF